MNIYLIHPYISYAIIAWGSACKTHISQTQTKQNHIIRTIFFATLFGENTERALPLLNLLNILTVNNVFLQTLKFIHNWHKQRLPTIFQTHFQYARNVHTYNTRYSSKDNLYKGRYRTETGKKTISSKASELWQKVPFHLKNLNSNRFNKEIKHFILNKLAQTILAVFCPFAVALAYCRFVNLFLYLTVISLLYIYMCIYIYVCVCVCMYVYIYIYIYIYIYFYFYLVFVCV